MKQHYQKVIWASLIILITAAYALKVSKTSSREGIPDPHSPHNPPAKHKPIQLKSEPGTIADSTMNSIQQSLAKREYNISLDEEKNILQSPNRRQNLRAYYKPGTLTIKNRIDSAGHNFSLQLINEGIFADGNKILAPQPDAALEKPDNKLVIKHKGFEEEFVNTEEGVRQNFIISAAPKSTKELQIRLSAQGLKVDNIQNNELQFYTEDKKGNIANKLIYKDIKCWDAQGETLPSTLRFQDGLVMLSVDVQDAVYPVTIDPIVVNGNPGNAIATLESNQAGAQAGYAVSSAGDVNADGYSDVTVGAPFFDKGESNEGVVFVYHGSASGVGVNPAIILEGNQKEAQFGTSAASAGDINKDGFSDIIIGAPYYDKTESNEGAAFVYYGSASGINNSGTILEANQPEAILGRSVEGLGDVNGDGFSDVIVGAPRFDKGENEEGAAFIYHGSAQGIVANPAMVLESNQATAYLGQSVAAAGDVNGDGFNDVLVGSTHYDKGQNDEGVVFVYYGSAVGVGANAGAVLEINQANAAFGWAVSTAGDVNGDGYSDVIVGSYLYDNNQSNEGAAFIYHGSSQGIKTAATSKIESNQIDARQGIAVACAGDVNGDGYSDILVGIWQYDKGESNEGAVILHYGTATGIAATPASTIEGNQANAAMGWSVKSAGDVNGDGYSDIILGANMFDKGQGDEGAAFVWLGMAEGVSNVAALKLTGSQDGSRFGISVASAGDVNGDGFSDVIVGAPYYNASGAAFIYHGSPQGLSTVPSVSIENVAGSGLLGYSVSSAGDVNGDGYADIIIGDMDYFISYDANNSILRGAALIYYGSSTGINKNLNSVIKSSNAGNSSSMGWVVASAGDVNGDGYGDVLVGDPNFDKQFDEGAAYVFHGTATGINPVSVLTLEGSQLGAQFGYSLSSAGDVNADGYSDILVGHPYFSNGQSQEGCFYLHLGSSSGIIKKAAMATEGDAMDANMGWAVCSAGDINADGFSDVVVSAYGYKDGQDKEGSAMIYYGSLSGLNPSYSLLESNKIDAGMGLSVSSAGDVNGDGYGDLAVWVPYFNFPLNAESQGAAYVYFGSISGIQSGTLPNIILKDFQQNPFRSMGTVASGGDINGDGQSDLLLGIPDYKFGSIITTYGNNNNKNPQNNLRLYNSNLTTPINQSQKAKSDFGAGLYAKSFLGKNRGKMVWETKALGQGFSKGANNAITNSTMSSGSQNAFTYLGLKGIELKSLIAKQGPSTKVRVRVKYDPALALTGQVYGPWRYLPAYLVGNSVVPVPDVVDDMSETVKKKVAAQGVDNDVVSIYPNPASDMLTIETLTPGTISQIQLFTASGKSVRKTSQRAIDVKGLDSGTYILVISRKDGLQTSQKVAINH